MFGSLNSLSPIEINTEDIGILYVNCSLFNPAPSLSAMIVNKHKLRGNINSFYAGEMGCRVGQLLLAKDLWFIGALL